MEETPSSIRRRRSALRLLNEMELGNEDWKTIQTNLDDTDAEIVVLAAIMGTRAAGQDRAKMSRQLREVLSSAPWYLREEIEICLFGAASQPRR